MGRKAISAIVAAQHITNKTVHGTQEGWPILTGKEAEYYSDLRIWLVGSTPKSNAIGHRPGKAEGQVIPRQRGRTSHWSLSGK